MEVLREEGKGLRLGKKEEGRKGGEPGAHDPFSFWADWQQLHYDLLVAYLWMYTALCLRLPLDLVHQSL